MAKLFTPFKLRGMTLKNRLVMAPMCMYEAQHDGFVQPFHVLHYGSRAMGQVGLIIIEATAVLPEGRITDKDLGIWSDEHIEGHRQITEAVKAYGAKIGIQLAHAGRKATVSGTTYAPSALPFDENYKTPAALTIEEIAARIEAFRFAAERAIKAGYDVLEIHAAHGYLINEFLSPLANTRTDQYGGSPENRYRFLREIIDTVRSIWQGPLLVRVSAHDYANGGLTIADYVQFARWMKAQDVDLIDVSSGAVVPAKIDAFPLYQVPFAAQIKQEAHIATGAVGLITEGQQAEQVLQDDAADLIFIGRQLLRDPYFPYTCAQALHVTIEPPSATYKRAW